ncbi:DUF5677 domain-containing protein [Paenibacillus sp. N1-5-1-14]|uniref:DUF5677 domain-containing protein n=1 Tax=Paenibacillus radicibacter TaxID=2972488 RepID=UPI002158D760|nr:DUF5677 domain-containing protein [Paenibacillus radicibacter]MCR8641279.1 DUF5677 domain-containing protein [Paenibacillus radicibacter]
MNKHRKIFDVCFDVNKFSHKVKFEFDINNNNILHVLSASLFLKILNCFQSIIILSKLGLESESKILTRTLIESLFVLKAISEDEKEINNFIKTDYKKREQLLKLIFDKDAENTYGEIRKKLDKEMYEELRSFNKEKDIRDIKVHEWAKKLIY